MRLLLIGLVCAGGVVLGWDAAAATRGNGKHVMASQATETEAIALPQSSTFVVVPIPSATNSQKRSSGEVARLEARNRRLEAMVQALERRQTEK